MKTITTLLLLCISHLIYSQNDIDYSSKLNDFEGIDIIDGAKINPKDRFATITSDYMVFSEKSAITFVNCLVKVEGTVDASSNCLVRLMNSYIICKKYKGQKTDRIIETDNVQDGLISEMKHLKKIKGNPTIEIINKSGKVIAKGPKKSLSDKIIKTGVYDIRSAGNFYNTNILLAAD